jgi:hypothetical protein
MEQRLLVMEQQEASALCSVQQRQISQGWCIADDD